MAEVFELDAALTTGLQPASNREILAAMLAALRDSHWCKALECSPQPGLMTPINLEVAASGAVQPLQGFDIARALAAAERRLFLLPHSRCYSTHQAEFTQLYGCMHGQSAFHLCFNPVDVAFNLWNSSAFAENLRCISRAYAMVEVDC